MGGVVLLCQTLYEPERLSPRRLEGRLLQMEQRFRRHGVSRVILTPEFPYGNQLSMIQPVRPLNLYLAMADLLTLGWLNAHRILPESGRVALTGPRLSPELQRTAEQLCRYVRGVRIDVPEVGDEYARSLHRKFGIPLIPSSAQVDVTVSFGTPYRGELELYGNVPNLSFLRLKAKEMELPLPLESQILTLLWERGELTQADFRVDSWIKSL